MSSFKGFKDRQRSVLRIDLSALIDVVFLLLIFYMVTTTFLEGPGLKLELPSSTSRASSRSEDVEVQISDTGEIFVGALRVALSDLRPEIEAALGTTASKTVIVKADRRVEHGLVVSVMDAARLAGAAGLVVATTPDAKDTAP